MDTEQGRSIEIVRGMRLQHRRFPEGVVTVLSDHPHSDLDVIVEDNRPEGGQPFTLSMLEILEEWDVVPSARTLADQYDAAMANLRAAQARVNAHPDELAARDDAIRAALPLRGPVAVIMETTGLSRARIYQIRDGRR